MNDPAEPWADSLPTLHAQHGATRRAMSRWRSPGLPTALDALHLALAEALGHPCAISCDTPFSSPPQDAIALTHDAWTTPITHLGAPLGVLALDQLMALAILDACFEHPPSPDRRPRPLSDFEGGLLLAHLSWLARRLQHHLGLHLSLPLNPDPTTRPTEILRHADEVVNINIDVSIGAASGRVSAHIPSERLREWLDGLAPPEAQQRQRRAAIAGMGLTTALEMEIARVRLAPESIPSMEPGGLLLGWCAPGQPIELTLRQGDRAVCLCRAESPDPQAPGIWRAIAPRDPQEIPMSGDPKSSVDVEALPIEVTLSLGEVQIPIGELVSLRPGDVLSLDGPLHRPVTLIAGGRKLASGELVRVGEALGVRIIEVVERA